MIVLEEYPFGFNAENAAREFFNVGKRPSKEYMDFLHLYVSRGEAHIISALCNFVMTKPVYYSASTVFLDWVDMAITESATHHSGPFLKAVFIFERHLRESEGVNGTISFFVKWMRYSCLSENFGDLANAIAADVPFYVVMHGFYPAHYLSAEASVIRNAIASDTRTCSTYVARLEVATNGYELAPFLFAHYLRAANATGFRAVMMSKLCTADLIQSTEAKPVRSLFAALREKEDFCVASQEPTDKLLSMLNYEVLRENTFLHHVCLLSDWPINGLILYRVLDRMSKEESALFVGQRSKNFGCTAMHEVVRQQCVMAAKILLGYQCIPMESWFVPDANGRTPIHWAAMCKHEDLLRLFLANVPIHVAEAKDRFGVTARDYASCLFQKTTDFNVKIICDSKSISVEDVFMA